MSVSSQLVLAGPFTGNGSTTAFPFTMQGIAADELFVQIDGTTVSPSLYSVSLSDTGGTVTFTDAPATGTTIYIYSNPVFDQPLALTNNGPFLSEAVEAAFDSATARDLYLKARVDTLFPSDGLIDEARVGKFIAFDAGGNAIFSNGTGADAGLREDLAGASGAALVNSSDGRTLQDFIDAFNGANGVDIASTSYELSDDNSGQLLRFTAATSVTVTVPAGLSEQFFCLIFQKGIGQITVEDDGDTTVHNVDSEFSTFARYVTLKLFAIAADEYVLDGRTAP